jgi:hypothetical protein
LSLGNEGLLGDPDVAFESFRSGMTNLIHRSRTNGFYPVITHAYAHTAYDTNRYAYVKRMNLLLNSWNVPGVNLLGPLDDGAGKWVTAYRSRRRASQHRGSRGSSTTLIVPSLFDAILAGTHQHPAASPAHTALPACREQMPRPFSFTPSKTMHSFNSAFRFRAGTTRLRSRRS